MDDESIREHVRALGSALPSVSPEKLAARAVAQGQQRRAQAAQRTVLLVMVAAAFVVASLSGWSAWRSTRALETDLALRPEVLWAR
jgi:anti-sigma factor RsiW